jgi:5-methylcytosine-specific restriction endonuclease McrA
VTSLPAKTCTRCGEVKSLEDYYRQAAAKDGRQYSCKTCVNTLGVATYAANIPPELVAKRQHQQEEATKGVKTCVKCNLTKPLTEYYKDSKSPGGYQYSCNICDNATSAKYREENKEAISVQRRTYREDNKDLVRLRKSQYYEKNKEVIKVTHREYAKNNRDKHNEAKHRRRARILGNGVQKYTTLQVLETYGTDCHLCNRPVDMSAPRGVGQPGWETGLHIDHVIPVSKGGQDSLANVRPSHGKCNVIKGGRLEGEF